MVKSPRAPSPQKPRWAFWTALPRIKLWEAVSLTFGEEPTERMRRVMVECTRDELTPAGEAVVQRLSDCQRAVSPYGPIEPQGPLWVGITHSPDCPVLLAEVAAFVVRCGGTIPDELQAANLPQQPAALESQATTQHDGKPSRATKDEDAAHSLFGPGTWSKRQRRQAERLKAYLDAGNQIPVDGENWEGAQQVADSLGIARQTLTEDLKAGANLLKERRRAGLWNGL
jgi:hypothetical protein